MLKYLYRINDKNAYYDTSCIELDKLHVTTERYTKRTSFGCMHVNRA